MTTLIENDSECVDYFNFTPLTWKRPEGPPRVWRVVEGRKKTADGQIPKFSIQEVPEELENDVVEYMIKNFILEEPLLVSTGLAKDPLAVREFRTVWRAIVHQGVSVVALMVDSDPTLKPVIAGVNVLSIKTAEDQSTSDLAAQFRGESLRKVIMLISKLGQESNVLKVYGVDRYLTAFGLSVQPSFRGQGLGEALLRARDDIGIAYRIPVSETIFTATASQILANRVGFEVLIEKKYSELLDDEGNVAFPDITVEFIKVMGRRFY